MAVAVKVLVVDDSSFFRRRLSEILEQDVAITVIGTACNGREAVDKVKELRPDVITMDIEMPIMDGISAVRQIMASNPTPVLMFSSLTQEGAKATLDALDAGALDFLPKRFEDIARDRDEAVKQLQQRVKSVARQKVIRSTIGSKLSPAVLNKGGGKAKKEPLTVLKKPTTQKAPLVSVSSSAYKASGRAYQILAIGTSTGGPVALQAVLSKIPENFPYPILLVQHMPSSFTPAFASRLNSLCKISVKEASHGDTLRPGWAYLAPGGKQMLIDGQYNNARIKIIDSHDVKVNYKPCVDITFASLAKVFRNKVLAVVLTGMGADGRDGAKLLKNNGSTIWAQDEASCVVYGMPQAVVKSGLTTQQFSLDIMADNILAELK